MSGATTEPSSDRAAEETARAGRSLGRRLARLALAGSAAWMGMAASGCSSSSATVLLHPGDDVAAAVATHGPGTTFELAPGLYRVQRTIEPKDRDSLIGRHGAVLSGATPLGDFRRVSAGVWAAPLPALAPTENNGAPGARLRLPQSLYTNNVFLDGHMLRKDGVRVGGRVVGRAPGELRPGGYFLDYDRRQLLLAADPAGHSVELATAPTLVQSEARDVTVRGLTLEMSADRGISAIGPGWVIADNVSRLNGTNGVTALDGALVEGNTIAGNGVYGITGSGAGIVVRGNTVSGNDASHVDPTGGGCDDAGGSKWVKTRGLRVVHNTFDGNFCNGIWLDIDNVGSVIAGNRATDNVGSGIVHEISYDARIRGNVVSGNSGYGILVRSSPGDVVSGNVVDGSGKGGIVLVGSVRTDHPSSEGPHLTRRTLVERNIVTLAAGAVVGVIDDGDPGAAAPGANTFDRNVYVLPAASAPSFWLHGARDAAAWRAAGQDRQSSFRFAGAP